MPYAEENKTIETTGLDETTKADIVRQSYQQLVTSRTFKRTRMAQIVENENLYHGIIDKTIRNPFNESFPFMPGFIDHLKSKIDDDSNLMYTNQAEADLKKANKINAFYNMESTSSYPGAMWDIKHRYAKTNALFSGVAIYKYYAEKTPDYKSCLEVISHYDFHNEPRGGGILENHLFCGQDNIYKNREDIQNSKYYDEAGKKTLLAGVMARDYKDNQDADNFRNNRLKANGQDAQTNNYVGQDTVKLVEWYTTYKGKRYYVLFHEQTFAALRCCLLTDLFPDNLYPYITWHTNEDGDVFWSKAPADDARPIARIINTMVNQELYNRQKRNYGQRAYDVDMFPNVQALSDWRPDGLIPVDTKGGLRHIQNGLYEVKVGDLNGTLDLVTWLDQFAGKQSGNTPSSMGASESDKKVGVFKGEIEQTERLIGIKNKSYRNALSRLGLLFKQGLEHNLTTPIAIKMMGAKGIEWSTLTKEDLKTERDLTITPVGGTSEISLKRMQENEKVALLTSPAITTVNPQWKDRQLLLAKGFTEDDIKDAFSSDTFAQKELMSEAAQAEKDIVEGKTPELNRGADSNFMQHIVDFATDTNDLPIETYNKLIDYAMAHTDIAVENEARNIKEMIRQKRLAQLTSSPTAPTKPTNPIPNNLSTTTPTPTNV